MHRLEDQRTGLPVFAVGKLQLNCVTDYYFHRHIHIFAQVTKTVYNILKLNVFSTTGFLVHMIACTVSFSVCFLFESKLC